MVVIVSSPLSNPSTNIPTNFDSAFTVDLSLRKSNERVKKYLGDNWQSLII